MPATYLYLEESKEKNQPCVFFCCTHLVADVLSMHTTRHGAQMTDKICDFLEACAALAVSAGFIFLAAYTIVGGI